MTTPRLVPPVRLVPELDVALTTDNLVALADELCASSFSLCDGVVTFTARAGAGVQRWQGVLGTRGLVRLPGGPTP
jgi:hypothetical protein